MCNPVIIGGIQLVLLRSFRSTRPTGLHSWQSHDSRVTARGGPQSSIAYTLKEHRAWRGAETGGGGGVGGGGGGWGGGVVSREVSGSWEIYIFPKRPRAVPFNRNR